MSWNRQQVSALIELYKQQELLYVVKNPTYHNKIARTQALEAIANSLQNIRPQTTANDVKTKINSLRTQFNKEITKLRSAPSGAGAETISITLWCFEDLLFLQDQSIARNSTSNLTPAQGYSDWAERVEIEEGTQQPVK